MSEPINYSPAYGPQEIENDWYIGAGQHVQLSNQTLIMFGNIIINSTGKLSLNNVTLILNNSVKTNNIIVQPNGYFVTSGSIIKTDCEASSSAIVFKENSTGRLSTTSILKLGAGVEESAATLVKSDDVILDNCTIKDSNYGTYLENCSPKIVNTLIEECSLGIYTVNSQGLIIDSIINNTTLSMKLTENTSLISIDSDFSEPQLDSSSKLLLKRYVSIQIIFKTPNIKPIKNAELLILNKNQSIYQTPGFGGNNNKTDKFGKIDRIIIEEKLFFGDSVTNYSTLVSVKYKSRYKNNHIVKKNKSKREVISLDNNLPILSSPSVTPITGTSDLSYRYMVEYSDADDDKPSKIQVEVDGIKYNMTIPGSGNDWKNGTWFNYKMYLSAGEHYFRFIANDGFGFEDVYIPNNNTISGPSVIKANSKPIMYHGTVSPASGNPDTVFSYQIKYYDSDGDDALIAKVYINNLAFDMVLSDNNPEGASAFDGLWFEFKTRLLVGEYEFYFKFKDDNGSDVVRWPLADEDDDDDETDDGTIHGPIVKPFENKMPIIGNGSVTPIFGHRNILFSYTISYFDAEKDEPTIAYVIIDGVPFNLTRARIVQNIYFFETYLPLGEHYFHFIFWDAENQHLVRYPAENGTEIIGPIVFDLPPEPSHGQVTPTAGDQDTLFTFSVIYDDLEDDMPDEAYLVLDNESYELIWTEIVNPPEENIIQYIYQTKLGLGEHNYYFVFISGEYIIRYPGDGYLRGPVVTDGADQSSSPNPDQAQSQPDPTDDNNITGNDSNQQIVVDENNNLTDQALSNFKDIIVLDYRLFFKKDALGNRYTFVLICHIASEKVNTCSGLVYVDGKKYLMSIHITPEKDIYNLSLSVYLSSDEHYYHYIVLTDDSEVRLPFKGEFKIPALEKPDLEQGKDKNLAENLINDQKLEIIQILIFVMIILAVIFFSFYRKYRKLIGY